MTKKTSNFCVQKQKAYTKMQISWQTTKSFFAVSEKMLNFAAETNNNRH